MENLLLVALMVFTPSMLLATVQMARKPGASVAKVIAMGAVLACSAWLVSGAVSKLQLVTGWGGYGVDLNSIALIIMVAGLLLFPVTLTLSTLFGLKDHQGTFWPGIGLGIAIAVFLHNNILDTAPINAHSMARLALDGLSPMLLWPPYRLGVRWLKNRLLTFGAPAT